MSGETARAWLLKDEEEVREGLALRRREQPVPGRCDCLIRLGVGHLGRDCEVLRAWTFVAESTEPDTGPDTE